MSISGVGSKSRYRWAETYHAYDQNQTSKDFDTAFKKAEKDRDALPETISECMEAIHARAQELMDKIEKGETEPEFQIGGQSYTIKEWDKMLAGFDKTQEDIREKMRAEHAQRMEKAEKAERTEQS